MAARSACAGDVSLTDPILMLDSDLDVGGEGGEAEDQEEDGERPLRAFELLTTRRRVLALEPAPLEGQPVEADAPVELDGEQEEDVQGPHPPAPDAIGRLVGTDAMRIRHHHVQ